MANLAHSLRFVCLLPLAAWLLTAHAQESTPAAATPEGAQTEAGRAPAQLQDPIPAAELAFLKDYTGHPAKDALKDKRMAAVLKQLTPRSEYHYGRDMPLSQTVDMMLWGSKQPVVLRENRYLMLSGAQGPYLSGRGFLWFDLETGIAFGGVYFHPVNGEPTPTLAIFSRQLRERSLGLSQLPLAFAEDLSQWVATSGVRWVSPRYFVPENGKKYVLLHDEDYCDHPPNAPAPDSAACMQLNAEAADADLNAAAFISYAHNAADAVAWNVAPDQMVWLGWRDRSCGIGPGTLPCRIRVTRQRTRTLLGRATPGV